MRRLDIRSALRRDRVTAALRVVCAERATQVAMNRRSGAPALPTGTSSTLEGYDGSKTADRDGDR